MKITIQNMSGVTESFNLNDYDSIIIKCDMVLRALPRKFIGVVNDEKVSERALVSELELISTSGNKVLIEETRWDDERKPLIVVREK